MGYSLPGSSVHRIFQARILDGLPFPPPRDLSNSGIKPVFPASPVLQVGSLLMSHQGSSEHHKKELLLLLLLLLLRRFSRVRLCATP